jgi:hypothetical protein
LEAGEEEPGDTDEETDGEGKETDDEGKETDCDETDEPSPSDGPVIVQFRNPNIGNVLSQLDPWFRITAQRDLDLTNLTIRYFYSINGRAPQSFYIDWASMDASLITGDFQYMGAGFDNADYFFELGFSGGQLQADETVEINVRIVKDDHSHFIQSNNFSFAGAAALATHIFWDRIAVFYDGVLIWGTEPGSDDGERDTDPGDDSDTDGEPSDNDTDGEETDIETLVDVAMEAFHNAVDIMDAWLNGEASREDAVAATRHAIAVLQRALAALEAQENA